jgi:hypothetical protein
MHSAVDLSRMCLVAALAVAAARAQSAPSAGEWTERNPPRGWAIVRTADFEVQAEIGETRAQRLAQFLQALRPQFEVLWPPDRRPKRQVIKLFASEASRAKWLKDHSLTLEARAPGTPPSAARLEPFTGDVMAFDTGRLLDVADGVEPVRLGSDRVIAMLHADAQQVYPLLTGAAAVYAPDVARDIAREAFRQYHLDTSPERTVPFWLEDAVGNWLAAATPGGDPWNLLEPSTDDSRKLQPGPVNHTRLLDARRAVADTQVIPAGDLLRRTAMDRETEPPGLLAQGWALVHLLMTSPDDARQHVIPALLAAYRSSAEPAVAVEARLADLDVAAFDAEWRAWLASQPVEDPLAELAARFGKVLRPTDLVAPDWIRSSYSWHRRHVPAPEPPP